MPQLFPLQSRIAIVTAILLLTACGKSEDKGVSQVAAKVNKEEISVHQINYVLSRSGNIPAEQVPAAGKQVLEKLIDQDLLMQKAVSDKLDRDPTVMQAVENAKRQILAQSYLDKAMSSAVKPSEDEIKDYYTKHPELFSQRRIYRFQQLSIAGGKDVMQGVEQQLTASKSLVDLATWAQGKNLQATSNASVKAAEQLPMELLPRLHQMKDGQIGVIAQPNGVSVIQLVASQEQPIDEKSALPTIEKYLLNQRKTELAENELKQLRATAAIEYVGDFAKKDTTPVAETKPVPVEPASQAAPGSSASSEVVSKAIAGMK